MLEYARRGAVESIACCECVVIGALGTRFENFFDESERIIPAFAAALAAADRRLIGELAARSHALTVSHLRNTVDETEHLGAPPMAGGRWLMAGGWWLMSDD